MRKLQGLFSKTARLTGSPLTRGDRRRLLSGGFTVDCLSGVLMQTVRLVYTVLMDRRGIF